jgi:hypothetical protein
MNTKTISVFAFGLVGVPNIAFAFGVYGFQESIDYFAQVCLTVILVISAFIVCRIFNLQPKTWMWGLILMLSLLAPYLLI